jgi:predicted metal-dependent hydrolase
MINSSKDEELGKGIDLFNRAQFFESHEVLEDLWRSLPREHATRRHTQGMVQLAVAFHHESSGNTVGARSVLERAIRNLNGAHNSFPQLDLARLRTELANWQEHFAGAVPRPKRPQIVMRKVNMRKIKP